MAEWMEVMNQFDRMCSYYQRVHECPMGCPMNGVNISQCRKIAFECPDSVERTVMSWAAEHPAPVYPSMAKYLEQFGIIIRCDGTMQADFFKAHEPMDADIAQKLGIEPKEG